MTILAATATVDAGPIVPFNGWRGNGTGLWPDAAPPLEWQRIPKGLIDELRSRADRPGDDRKGDPLEKGIIRDWLVIGPFPLADSVKDFDKAPLAGDVQPADGDKVGSVSWNKLSATSDDPFAFGPAVLPWTELAPAVGGYQRNQAAYVHTYLYSPKGGIVRAVAEHAHGMKAWLNGKVVYRGPGRAGGMGFYYSMSRVELGIYDLTPSPRFDLELKPGWNRLLLMVTTANIEGWKEHQFLMRLMDMPDVAYESKNVLWMSELPHRSNATPIVVGERIFVMSEPDELICLDKNTGKMLWSAASNYYELLTPAEKNANPAFAQKVEPLLAKLGKESDFINRQRLRTKIQRTLVDIDADRFAWKADGHFEGHFGIVGFTTPTPVSDGKHVYVWVGNGVAACYDLEGRRKWITRVPAKELTYASSPALIDGTLAVFLGKLIGLDADTGKMRWEQKKVNINNGAVLAARLAGVPVFVAQRGHVVRARDGHVLYRQANPPGDTGWAPPVILGDIVYQPNYGVSNLNVVDYAGMKGDDWEPARKTIEIKTGPKPDGTRADRWTAGSPLVVGGRAYLADIYATVYAADVNAKKFLYNHDTGLRGFFHYNAVPVAASPTLIGKQIVIQDNQGTALVMTPGDTYQAVRKNRLATRLDRYWPIPAQETTGYAPPVVSGNRIYIRGEKYLYCIGVK